MTMLDMPAGTVLHKRLKIARMLAELEQEQIADMIGVARNTVSNWERGRSEPSATMFVRWAAATGVTLEWLAEGVETTKAPAEAGADASLSQHSVRPKGLEPLTFWSVVADLLEWGHEVALAGDVSASVKVGR